MSTSNSEESNDDSVFLVQLHVAREILLKPFEKSPWEDGNRKQSKVIDLHVPMEEHIIALKRCLS